MPNEPKAPLMPCPDTKCKGSPTLHRGVHDVWVLCGCGFAGPRRSSDDEAAEAWSRNRRPPIPPEVEGAVKALEEDLAYHKDQVEAWSDGSDWDEVMAFADEEVKDTVKHHQGRVDALTAALAALRSRAAPPPPPAIRELLEGGQVKEWLDLFTRITPGAWSVVEGKKSDELFIGDDSTDGRVCRLWMGRTATRDNADFIALAPAVASRLRAALSAPPLPGGEEHGE